MTWLVVESQQGGFVHEIGQTSTIGRGKDSSVVLRDGSVSRHHCSLERRGDALFLRDLGTLNGTFLNGRRLQGEVEVAAGALIRVGSTSLRLRAELPEAARESEAPRPPLDPNRQTSPSLPDVDLDLGPTIENGQLVIGRGGDVRVQLWNLRVEEGGIFLRIPLVGDRPPSSQLQRYVGNPKHEYIVLDASDEAFAALLAEAQRDGGALPERARVDYLHNLVYRALGGLQSQAKLDACLAWCDAQANREVPIGALIRMGAGACRHRAFLFFHLARRLGLGVELCRGAVPQGRHAWNVVRVDGRRVFVDTAFGLVIDDARAAEQAHGYVASRHDVSLAGEGRALIGDDPEGGLPEDFRFHHELRKVPGDEEAVLLLCPERAAPEVRYLHLHFRIGPRAAAMFVVDPFVSARVYAVVGDEAHHRMDAIDPAAIGRLRRAWTDP